MQNKFKQAKEEAPAIVFIDELVAIGRSRGVGADLANLANEAALLAARRDHERVRMLFFTSGRRHTMFSRDWSSDVCSSDLAFDYVCKLDTDLDLPPRYFERLMERMER